MGQLLNVNQLWSKLIEVSPTPVQHTLKPDQKYDHHQLSLHEEIWLAKSVIPVINNERLKSFHQFFCQSIPFWIVFPHEKELFLFVSHVLTHSSLKLKAYEINGGQPISEIPVTNFPNIRIACSHIPVVNCHPDVPIVPKMNLAQLHYLHLQNMFFPCS